MKSTGVHIRTVAASLAIALVLLFGGREVFIRTSVARPLRIALASMPEITSHSTEATRKGMVLSLRLEGVNDLEETMKRASWAASAATKRDDITIRILDSRDDALREAYHRIHFVIQEAISTGSFASMESRAQAIAKAAGVSSCRLWVDEECVYIALSNGSHELYEVAPRGVRGDVGGGVPATW
ncbi:MAG: hypothetical protein VB144_13340 [Clostridia bacterium]|nr:hypothetical protein [Clostridia bacterium]